MTYRTVVVLNIMWGSLIPLRMKLDGFCHVGYFLGYDFKEMLDFKFEL